MNLSLKPVILAELMIPAWYCILLEITRLSMAKLENFPLFGQISSEHAVIYRFAIWSIIHRNLFHLAKKLVWSLRVEIPEILSGKFFIISLIVMSHDVLNLSFSEKKLENFESLSFELSLTSLGSRFDGWNYILSGNFYCWFLSLLFKPALGSSFRSTSIKTPKFPIFFQFITNRTMRVETLY